MNEMTNNQDNKNSGRDKEPFLRRAMDAFGTMFALNICFVVGCIPIFTIGASFTALYAMCIRLQEDEEFLVSFMSLSVVSNNLRLRFYCCSLQLL